VPDGAFILHLADRVEVAMDRRTPILSQMDDIRGRIVEQSDKMFKPEHVEAFLTLAGRESFWLDLVNPTKDKAPRRRLGVSALLLDVEGLEQMARMFGHIVDFRSRFTATHSSGVAATAQSLAELSGFDHIEAKAMRIAGYLHDLGKLAVPAEILEKPAALSEDELGVVRTHSYHTYHVLDGISGFETINEWGAFHHERLDGRGYPFHHRDDAISVGSRIMAVADVLTALCEDRPYRAALGTDKALSILDEMVGAGAMDAGVVDLLEKHVDEVDLARVLEQQASARDYDAFYPEGEPAATPGATS
jgi:HD-GYP domain-containing protein (c-di-GMP phosphodiesterase class II)